MQCPFHTVLTTGLFQFPKTTAPPPPASKLVFKFGCHLGGREWGGNPPFSLADQKYNSLSAFMTVGLLLAGLTDLLKGRINQSEGARW
jgi:hypothetical protein